MRAGAKLTRARQLRRKESFAEKRLWEQLRNRNLEGLKFVRQATVSFYIADFLCREHELIVEVDGATHSTGAQQARDNRRTEHLEALGYRVIRFHNDEVIHGMDEVLTLFLQALKQ